MLAAMVWLGPLLAFAGVAAYFVVFMNLSVTRDLAWLSLVVLALAIGVSVLGLVRARRRVLAAAGLVLTLALSGFFVWWAYVFAFDLPQAELALDVGAPVPAVTLADDRGQPVELASLARDRLVLVFFRGHW
jgi:cytochrome oxidase Cu insertion factor (SCO1/SenC/PrrC family)